jgi:multidrug efflux pump subunit AcrA (membrane-fusion protein)
VNSGNGTIEVKELASGNEQATASAQTRVAVSGGAGATDAEKPAGVSGGRRTAGIVCAVALLAAIAWGLHLRAANEAAVAHATQDAAILTVSVVHPVDGSKADELALPGNVEAFTDTPIYSRTNGYLKKWYFDIGAHVRKGDLLAEIDARGRPATGPVARRVGAHAG